MFDDMLVAQIRRLNDAWPELVAPVQLYRMPLQSHARSRMDLQFAIRDEVVLRLAELYGRRPEEIDPDWGM